MDPIATLMQAMIELADGNRDAAARNLHALGDWLGRGGFCPEVDVQRHAHKLVVTIETGR